MGRKPIKKYRYKDPEIRKKHTVRFMVYFQNNGIENFSMSKMAADLKMSKTTIYNHFTTKEEIIEAAVDRSEERRVGKECRSRRSPYHKKKKR